MLRVRGVTMLVFVVSISSQHFSADKASISGIFIHRLPSRTLRCAPRQEPTGGVRTHAHPGPRCVCTRDARATRHDPAAPPLAALISVSQLSSDITTNAGTRDATRPAIRAVPTIEPHVGRQRADGDPRSPRPPAREAPRLGSAICDFDWRLDCFLESPWFRPASVSSMAMAALSRTLLRCRIRSVVIR